MVRTSRVGELRGRTALANAKILEPVVYEAEDGNDEGAKIHKKTSVPIRRYWADTERKGVFSVAQVLKETRTRG